MHEVVLFVVSRDASVSLVPCLLDVLGLEREVALDQLVRIVQLFDDAGLLESSVAHLDLSATDVVMFEPLNY